MNVRKLIAAGLGAAAGSWAFCLAERAGKTTVSIASLCMQKDEGTTIQVSRVPLAALAAEHLSDVLCEALGTRLCSPPDAAYRLRWGPVDDLGIAVKSAGHLWYSFGEWLHTLTFKHETHVATLPVTAEWVREHYPDAGWPWDGSDLEEQEGDPGQII